MINYMTNKEYNNEENVKLFIVTNQNIPIIATKESDGTPMKETYHLDYYSDDYKCKYHIDYLQVLLNKYFKNTELEKYIGNTDNENTERIIKELVNNNNVVLSNITLYDSISYKIDNKLHAILYINKNITNSQIKILQNNQKILKKFNIIEIYLCEKEQLININQTKNQEISKKLTRKIHND